MGDDRMAAIVRATRLRTTRTRSWIEGLDAAQLPDGRAHGPRPLPDVPHLELRPDDAAHRRLPDARRRRDPRASGRQGARRALLRAPREVQGADPALRHRSPEARRARPEGRGDHLVWQSLHDLCPLPRVQHLDPRALGQAAAEHGVRRRQVHPRPRLPPTWRAHATFGGGGHRCRHLLVDNDEAQATLDSREIITDDG